MPSVDQVIFADRAAGYHQARVEALIDVVAPTLAALLTKIDGRTKALGSTASRAIRVLSPRIEPPVRVEDGSTASTATLYPCAVRWLPSVSMVSDLPTPGAPVMPTRMAWPVAGKSSCTSRCAFF